MGGQRSSLGQGFFPAYTKYVEIWNVMLEEVVESDTIITFKSHIDNRLNRHGMEGTV